MIIKKLKKDSIDTTKRIRYSKLFNEELKNKVWKESEIFDKIRDFVNGNFGDKVAPKNMEINKINFENKKGPLVGIYSNRNGSEFEQLVLYYSDETDTIYVITKEDFKELPLRAWRIGEEEFNNRYKTKFTTKKQFGGEDYEEEDIKYKMGFLYNTYGLEYNKAQREQIKHETGSNIKRYKWKEDQELQNRISELEKLINKLKKENKDTLDLESELNELIQYGKQKEENDEVIRQDVPIRGYKVVTNEVVNSTKEEIEKNPEKNKLPTNAKEVLEGLAKKYNVNYDDIIEKISFFNRTQNRNLQQAYDFVIKNIDKPYFFTDAKKRLAKNFEKLFSKVYKKPFKDAELCKVVADAVEIFIDEKFPENGYKKNVNNKRIYSKQPAKTYDFDYFMESIGILNNAQTKTYDLTDNGIETVLNKIVFYFASEKNPGSYIKRVGYIVPELDLDFTYGDRVRIKFINCKLINNDGEVVKYYTGSKSGNYSVKADLLNSKPAFEKTHGDIDEFSAKLEYREKYGTKDNKVDKKVAIKYEWLTAKDSRSTYYLDPNGLLIYALKQRCKDKKVNYNKALSIIDEEYKKSRNLYDAYDKVYNLVSSKKISK